MLIGLEPRKLSPSFFVTDMDEWKTGDRETKASLLVIEWLSLYIGENVGPLDRQPMETWLRAFLEVGYFEASYTVTETRPNFYEEALKIEFPTEPLPESVPDLYRISTRAGARRFSWCAQIHGLREVIENEELKLWRCRKPIRAFGTVTNRYDLLPGTQFWEQGFAINQVNPYTEWLVAPGNDVREMLLVDPGTDDPNFYLTEGKSI